MNKETLLSLVVLCILSYETSIFILATSAVARALAYINPIYHLTGFSFNLSQPVVVYIHVPEGKIDLPPIKIPRLE
jgi:hypothetical protein